IGEKKGSDGADRLKLKTHRRARHENENEGDPTRIHACAHDSRTRVSAITPRIWACSTRDVVGRVAPCPTWRMDETPMHAGYLVVVPAADPTLFEYLEHCFKGDPATSVLVERRKKPRLSPRAVVLFHGITLVRLGMLAPPLTRSVFSRTDDR